jgi:hypothetical protein
MAKAFPAGIPNSEPSSPAFRLFRNKNDPPLHNQEIAMRIAVLTYHSQNVTGNDYANNDHVAFREDVEQVLKANIGIVSLRQISDALRGKSYLPDRAVAFSCDDGADLDFRDIYWPHLGLQQSFATIIREFAGKDAKNRFSPMTSFVIADPKARQELDNRCLYGLGWMSDNWWQPAVLSGICHIGIHGWDHCHPELERYSMSGSSGRIRAEISSYQDAQEQVLQAISYISTLAPNPGTALFAFPFGKPSEYLVREYLPNFQTEHQLSAAFSTEPATIHRESNIWSLPRYVCGYHWKSPEDFSALLKSLN